MATATATVTTTVQGAPNYKSAILDALEVMRRNSRQERNFFKERAYNTAMAKLNAPEATRVITTIEDIEPLKLGKGTVEKIAEIIATGKLGAAEDIKAESKFYIADELLKVHGIGPIKARELITRDGIRSIVELRERQDELLNEKQRIGLKYFDDIQLRIPRAEMEKHKKLIKTYMCNEWIFDIVGSYRRGQKDSGDIDVLMTLPDNIPPATRKEMFAGVIATFKVIGYVQASLAEGDKKFMGVVKLPKGERGRRLDLMLTPAEEYGYALLYFTGSDKFNIQVRAQATKLGYTMNEHKLTPIRPGVPEPPIMKTEEEILSFLGIAYMPPEARTGKILLV